MFTLLLYVISSKMDDIETSVLLITNLLEMLTLTGELNCNVPEESQRYHTKIAYKFHWELCYQ